MPTSTKRTHSDRQANGHAPLSNYSSSCNGQFSLQRRVRNFLECRHVPGVERIKIEVDGNTVTVHGVLPSPDAKRICLECCRHVAGVIRLIDEVEVVSSPQKGVPQEIEECFDEPRAAFPRQSR